MRLKSIIPLKIKYLHWRLRALGSPVVEQGPIFIGGTGRSGTHFLTRTLITHPALTDLVGGRENPYVFKRVEALAQASSRPPAQLKSLSRRYRTLCGAAYPLSLVDQSHTNIWLATYLAERFPCAKFLVLVRNPVSVAFSTTMHKGVRRWLEPPYPVPIDSGFVGNRNNMFSDYEDLSIYQKSAIRWASHIVQTNELIERLSPEVIRPISYEDLCSDPKVVLAEISDFLGVDDEFEMPEVDTIALEKWKQVPKSEVENMEEIIRHYFSEYPLDEIMSTLVKRYMILPEKKRKEGTAPNA